MTTAPSKSEIKNCMQCDTGRASIDRRCNWCKFLSCEDCMIEGMHVCLHCIDTRDDLPKTALGGL